MTPMHLNMRLDTVGAYPFDRLRSLLGDVLPPSGIEPIPLSLGEPKHAPPSFLAEVIARESAAWSKYPPMRGSDDARRAIAAAASKARLLDSAAGCGAVAERDGTQRRLLPAVAGGSCARGIGHRRQQPDGVWRAGNPRRYRRPSPARYLRSC